MKRTFVTALLSVPLLVGAALAQPPAAARGPQAPPAREDGLDPSPINPATDPDVGKFLNDWRNAKPRSLYGKLVVHDILTKLDSADAVRPHKRGAVLTAITAVSYAELAPGATASGRSAKGERQVFLATGGAGKITVNGKTYDVRDGVGFTLTPDFDFKLTSTGKAPLAFYVRTEPMPANLAPQPDLVLVNRFDNDRRVGAHWVHICNGGPSGMTLCTIAPHTMPQPHSHPGEEAWIMVKGKSILSLGKTIQVMTPGQAYKIPPTGLAAHSNLNLTDEPIEMIYMGPVDRTADAAAVAARGLRPNVDFARLDNSAIVPAAEQDVDMFVGAWRDAFPRIAHGNLYMRDMLTALQGPDSLHPTRKGAVLTSAQAVSYAMLEPGSTAHRVEGELKGAQEVFVVQSGTGTITAGGKSFALSKDKAFIITPDMDFKLTATGRDYLTFYVVTEKLPAGAAAARPLTVVDHRSQPQVAADWVHKTRPVIQRADGLGQYAAVSRVELGTMAMSRPASATPGSEEIWIATDGDIDMLFGKMLRKLPAGTAYVVPATGITAHANLNVSGKTAQLLSIVR